MSVTVVILSCKLRIFLELVLYKLTLLMLSRIWYLNNKLLVNSGNIYIKMQQIRRLGFQERQQHVNVILGYLGQGGILGQGILGYTRVLGNTRVVLHLHIVVFPEFVSSLLFRYHIRLKMSRVSLYKTNSKKHEVYSSKLQQ